MSYLAFLLALALIVLLLAFVSFVEGIRAGTGSILGAWLKAWNIY